MPGPTLRAGSIVSLLVFAVVEARKKPVVVPEPTVFSVAPLTAAWAGLAAVVLGALAVLWSRAAAARKHATPGPETTAAAARAAALGADDEDDDEVFETEAYSEREPPNAVDAEGYRRLSVGERAYRALAMLIFAAIFPIVLVVLGIHRLFATVSQMRENARKLA